MKVIVYKDGEPFGVGKFTENDNIVGVNFPNRRVKASVEDALTPLIYGMIDEKKVQVREGGHDWMAKIKPNSHASTAESHGDLVVDQLEDLKKSAEEWYEMEAKKEQLRGYGQTLSGNEKFRLDHNKSNAKGIYPEMPPKYTKKFMQLMNSGLKGKELAYLMAELADNLSISLQEGETTKDIPVFPPGEHPDDRSNAEQMVKAHGAKYYIYNMQKGDRSGVYDLYNEDGELVMSMDQDTAGYPNKVAYVKQHLEERDQMWHDIWEGVCPACGYQEMYQTEQGNWACPNCGWGTPDFFDEDNITGKKPKSRTNHPRQLPIIEIEGERYYKDERRREYRNVDDPSDTIEMPAPGEFDIVDNVPVYRDGEDSDLAPQYPEHFDRGYTDATNYLEDGKQIEKREITPKFRGKTGTAYDKGWNEAIDDYRGD